MHASHAPAPPLARNQLTVSHGCQASWALPLAVAVAVAVAAALAHRSNVRSSAVQPQGLSATHQPGSRRANKAGQHAKFALTLQTAPDTPRAASPCRVVSSCHVVVVVARHDSSSSKANQATRGLHTRSQPIQGPSSAPLHIGALYWPSVIPCLAFAETHWRYRAAGGSMAPPPKRSDLAVPLHRTRTRTRTHTTTSLSSSSLLTHHQHTCCPDRSPATARHGACRSSQLHPW